MKGYIELMTNEGFVVSINADYIESVAPMVAAEGREEAMAAEFPGCNSVVNTVRGQIIVKETYTEVLTKISNSRN